MTYLEIFFKIHKSRASFYGWKAPAAAIAKEIPRGRHATAAAVAAAVAAGAGGDGSSGVGEQIENGFSRCAMWYSFKRRRAKAFAGLFAAGCYPAAIFRPSRSA